VGVPLLERDASHARRLALALAALIPLVSRRLGQAAGAGRTHEGLRARALRALMALLAAAVCCPLLAAKSTARRAVHDALVELSLASATLDRSVWTAARVRPGVGLFLHGASV